MPLLKQIVVRPYLYTGFASLILAICPSSNTYRTYCRERRIHRLPVEFLKDMM
ncbi:hypothetical protein K439DRAFT_1635475 [Ramaria rubella]|nr:hypothetical protein K439DRAFT_1635475 [Ramaria rubella]